MLRIRRVPDDTLPGDRRDIARAQQILRQRLPGIDPEEIAAIPERLSDPMKYEMPAILLVADNLAGRMQGFALMSHVPAVGFCLLDYIAAGRSATSGVGGALYTRIRETAKSLGVQGVFFECLPDDPSACSDPTHASANAARLRFYERYGAFPIINTAYETPLEPGGKDMPHLVFDDLGRGAPPTAAYVRDVVRTILEKKYGHICSPEYVDQVVASITDDPVRLREPRYLPRRSKTPMPPRTGERMIGLVVNDKHDIHHVRERGYVESPVRVRSILKGLEESGLFWQRPAKDYGDSAIRAVHAKELVDYLKRVCPLVPENKSVYPYVFPVRNHTKPPRDLTFGAGYYCIDTFTPLNRNAYAAAREAVNATLTAADMLLDRHPLAYALVRPPGHHAERSAFGGFCYFNNNAIAAHHLSSSGKVAILDIDYHHGNGQQDVFFERDDVLTVSIHGDPSFAYPFFSGFADEIGTGAGTGFNLNMPLSEKVDGVRYTKALIKALARIREFAPRFLVVALGLDTAKHDPTGTWSLGGRDFENNGRLIGALQLPTLVVQEGGYRTATLGTNARSFFVGLNAGHAGALPQ